jgi:hypothetical protein
MYSGFVTSKKTVSAVGVHQRFDTVALGLIEAYVVPGTFPSLGQILHFEGINGPDGLKVKSPGKDEPSHLYNPTSDTGPIPALIDKHYKQLVVAIKLQDMVRASYEAAWMAHYVCDGLTPAHHYPLDQELAAREMKKNAKGGYSVKRGPGETAMDAVRKGWAVFGRKGLLSMHFNFEMGVATTLMGQKIKVQLDTAKLAEAKKLGAINFFKKEAKEVAELGMYERFYRKGWDATLARQVKTILAPQSVQAIAIIWLLAYLDAGKELALEVNLGNK